jgi:hypothetical protein
LVWMVVGVGFFLGWARQNGEWPFGSLPPDAAT